MKLSISTPCHEDWAAMTPGTEGRYCAKCQLSVVDFAQMDEARMEATLSAAPGRVCGRIPLSQLSGQVRTMLAIFAASFLLAFGIPASAQAQQLHEYRQAMDKGVGGRVMSAYNHSLPMVYKVELWQADSLVDAVQTDSLGNWHMPVAPGKYTVRIGGHWEWLADNHEIVVTARKPLYLGNMQVDMLVKGKIKMED